MQLCDDLPSEVIALSGNINNFLYSTATSIGTPCGYHPPTPTPKDDDDDGTWPYGTTWKWALGGGAFVVLILLLPFCLHVLRKRRKQKQQLQSAPEYVYRSSLDDGNQSRLSTALSDDGSVHSDLSLGSQQEQEEEVRAYLELWGEELVKPNFRDQTRFRVLGKVGGRSLAPPGWFTEVLRAWCVLSLLNIFPFAVLMYFVY